MPPTPLRIAQTSNEAKKEYKKNGPRLPERQQKQLERAYELDIRAARAREAEDRRKTAKKKREEREEKEKAARKQMGVGLATQLIGYSHTQAQLKNGMEAFLGVKKRKEEEQRKKDLELTKKLEEIAQLEKEPWDDDDADGDDIALDLPQVNTSFGEQYVDNDLDDDTLLEAHDLVMSDPLESPAITALSLRKPTPLPAPTVPKAARQPPPPPAPALPAAPSPPVATTKQDAGFVRLHGPINKAVEAILEKLPEPLVELLSQDVSMKLPEWDPAPGLLHKLSPLGLPPHRLRIKKGSIVALLRDLNTSSQLSKSQHLRVLRAENLRLECLVLDGQLEGTKAFLTRIAFPAKYRNDDAFPFQRTQFPVRVATGYTPSIASREISQSSFKVPTISGQVRASSFPKRPSSLTVAKPNPKPSNNPTFKLPSLPASKSAPSVSSLPAPAPQKTAPLKATPLDVWDEFLESGTQIARELSLEATAAPMLPPPIVKTSSSITESLPPLSTQDFDFSLDDLDDAVQLVSACPSTAKRDNASLESESPPSFAELPANKIEPPRNNSRHSMRPLPRPRASTAERTSKLPSKSRLGSKEQTATVVPIDLGILRPSQRPRTVTGVPDLSRKRCTPPINRPQPLTKRPRVQMPRSPTTTKTAVRHHLGFISDFSMSTQEAASFFDDDDDFMLGSPPIIV